MFCSKCGTQVADSAAFCPKCGTMLKQNAVASERITKASAPQPVTSAGKMPGRKVSMPVLVLSVLAVVVLVLGIVFLVSGKDSPADSSNRTYGTDSEKAENSKKKTEADEKRELTELTVDTPTVLEGNYENLKTLVSNGAQVTLDGEFPALTKVVMNPGADGMRGDFVFEYGTRFPALTQYQGSKIVTRNYGEDGFDLEAFSVAQSMEFYAKNSEVDEEWLTMIAYAQVLQNGGTLTNMTYDVSHEISDLYGAWTNEKNTLMLTFQSDGTVRVAESMNLIGVDALVFSEVSENVLSLKAKNYTENMLFGVISDLVSFHMEYKLLGDKLFVRFLESEFELTRVE